METEKMQEAIRKIEAQQAKAETHSTVWMVGEQIKDILRAEPRHAGLITQDLENAGMSIAECEKKIRARADELHKTVRGSGVAVSPREAEDIIRKFYGLPERGAASAVSGGSSPARESREGVIDIADFF